MGGTPQPGRGMATDEQAQLSLPTQGKRGQEEDKAEVGIFNKGTWSMTGSCREWQEGRSMMSWKGHRTHGSSHKPWLCHLLVRRPWMSLNFSELQFPHL